MLKLKELTLDGVPANLKALFAVDDEGNLTLDETKVRTETDVANVKRDKDKERDAANQYKAELAKYKELGDLEEVKSRLANADENAGEKLVSTQKELHKVKSDYATLKGQYDSIQPQYEKMKADLKNRKTADILTEFVKTLQNVDGDKLTRALKKDIQLGIIGLDESEQGLVCKDGTDITQYANDVAKDYGFVTKSTPGGSQTVNPITKPQVNRTDNNQRQQYKQEESIFDAEEISKLNS
jgi:hypothetical protein